MNERKKSLANILTLFLILFFSLIAFFVAFAVLGINEYNAFPAVLTFLIINLIILLIIVGGGSSIGKIAGFASYVSICVVTTIYTLLQFIYMGLRFNSTSIINYTLYNLIVLFLYLVIVIPIVLLGAKNKSE